MPPTPILRTDLGSLALGLMTAAPVAETTASVLARITRRIVDAGGSVLIPESDSLLAQKPFLDGVRTQAKPHATLAYGEPLKRHGFHVVATETDHWTENLAGLGGCGAQLFLTVVQEHARLGHPLLPVIQVAQRDQTGTLPGDDIDLFLSGNVTNDELGLLNLLVSVAQHELVPSANAHGFTDFQLTRGLLGVST